jgi:hypothetical protein
VATSRGQAQENRSRWGPSSTGWTRDGGLLPRKLAIDKGTLLRPASAGQVIQIAAPLAACQAGPPSPGRSAAEKAGRRVERKRQEVYVCRTVEEKPRPPEQPRHRQVYISLCFERLVPGDPRVGVRGPRGRLLSTLSPGPRRWRPPSTAGDSSDGRRFRITHPFHPLNGQEYELVGFAHTWGEHRVFFRKPGDQRVSLVDRPVSPTTGGGAVPSSWRKAL